MALDINIHSSEEEENIHIQVAIPKVIYDTFKGIVTSADAGKIILNEVRKLLRNKEDV